MNRGDISVFCLELERWMDESGVDLVRFEGMSGVRMPVSRHMYGEGHESEDWETLCYVCLWLRFQGRVLPDEFVSRLVFGPSNRWSAWLVGFLPAQI